MIRGDDRAEGVAEYSEPIEPQRLREQVDVARENIQRERCRVDTLRAALAALVNVQKPVPDRERVQVRPKHVVVQTRAAVQNDQRETTPELLDTEVVAVRQRDEHARTLIPATPSTRRWTEPIVSTV